MLACAEAVEDETSLWKEKENAVENSQGAHFVELLEVLPENIAPDLSQFSPGRRCSLVNALTEAVVEMKVNEQFDLESIFLAQYDRIARVIARVVRDHARAEELAVEVFLKLWGNQKAQGNQAEGWLYRVAVRTALDELRRQTRRARYERLSLFARRPPTPEEIHTAAQEQERVRLVLSVLARRHAESCCCAARTSVTAKWHWLSI